MLLSPRVFVFLQALLEPLFGVMSRTLWRHVSSQSSRDQRDGHHLVTCLAGLIQADRVNQFIMSWNRWNCLSPTFLKRDKGLVYDQGCHFKAVSSLAWYGDTHAGVPSSSIFWQFMTFELHFAPNSRSFVTALHGSPGERGRRACLSGPREMRWESHKVKLCRGIQICLFFSFDTHCRPFVPPWQGRPSIKVLHHIFATAARMGKRKWLDSGLYGTTSNYANISLSLACRQTEWHWTTWPIKTPLFALPRGRY